MRILTLILLLIAFHIHAEVIPIQPLESCFSCSSKPSMTMYWQGKESKAVVIFIPGGEGYIGLKEGELDHPYQFFQTLKRLTNPDLTSGKFDVVLLDSPSELSPNQMYPSARGAFDHMIRIESAIRYYKEKTGLPVWLMGHSNGGLVTKYLPKVLSDEGKTDLVDKIISVAVPYLGTPAAVTEKVTRSPMSLVLPTGCCAMAGMAGMVRLLFRTWLTSS